jgi:hypothetical protein
MTGLDSPLLSLPGVLPPFPARIQRFLGAPPPQVCVTSMRLDPGARGDVLFPRMG